VNVNVSGPVRVFALVGGLAALALGVWFFLLGGMSPSASSEPAKVIKPLYGGKKAPTAPTAKPKPRRAAETPATATATAAKPGAARPQVQAQPKAAPKPKAKPKPAPLANPEKLPLAVARALARHPVVVVALYSPEAKVDRISLGEARAGAERAHVGFVALNALDRRASEALMRKLGVLSAPAFFLYKRPGKLVMRIDGFADRDLVAQAAVTALPPTLRRSQPAPARKPAAVTQARWSNRANAICVEGGVIPAQPTSREQVLKAWPALLADFKRDIARLNALPLPTSPTARTRTKKLLTLWGRVHAIGVGLLEAVKANDAARFNALQPKLTAQSNAANRLAADVGATSCTVT
jgi:hypothetical protein